MALNPEDCTFSQDGLTVTLRRSKTDQTGAGRRGWNPVRIESRDAPGAHTSIVD